VDLELVISATPEEASEAVAERLARQARAGGAIALSGGSTPRRSHELAAALEPDWGRAEIWLADERVVPRDDPLSNARLVQETLLAHVQGAPVSHFVRTELQPVDAAAAYDLELRDVRLELALLGLGADGHTASLFPNAPSLDEQERLAVAVEPGLEPFVPRVTMTIPALAAARELVFLVTGADKADAVRKAFAEAPSRDTPASLVRSRSGGTTVILDAAAARLLSQ